MRSTDQSGNSARPGSPIRYGNPGGGRDDDPSPSAQPVANPLHAADRLRDVLVRLFGRPVPVRIRAWDGTESGPVDAPLLTVRSRRALRRVLWRPDELGLARAFVAGEVTVEDPLVDVLERLAELGGVAQRSAPTRPARPGGADRRELLRTAVLLGAVGPQPKPPPEEAGEQLEPIPYRLARLVLGETLATGAADHAVLLGAPAESEPGTETDVAPEDADVGVGPAPAGVVHELGPTDGVRRPGAEADLDGAQRVALSAAWSSLGLLPGSRILDLRAGWGAFLRAAGEQRAEGWGYVQSPEQAEAANARLAEAGLRSRVGVRVGHWQEATDGAPYDAVVALGHTPGGSIRADELAVIRDLLRPSGRLLVEVLTRRAADQPPDDGGLVGAYLGPEAALPTLGEAIGALDAADLEVVQVTSIRQAAMATVRTWVARLEAHEDEAAELAGIGRIRLWRLLLAGLATGLWSGKIGAHRVLARSSDGARPESLRQLPEQRAEAS